MIRTAGRVALKWYEHDSTRPRARTEKAPEKVRSCYATNGRAWTVADDALLAKLWPTITDRAVIAERLGRTRGAINTRAGELGLGHKK